MWQMLRTLKYFAPKYVNVLRLTIVRQSTNQVTNQALSLPFCTCPAWVFPTWQTMSSKERFPRGALQKELAACQGLREEAALSELPAGGSSSSSWVEPGGKWQAAPYTWPTHLYLHKHPLAGTAGLSHFRVPSHQAFSSQEHFFRTASCQVLSSTQSLTAPHSHQALRSEHCSQPWCTPRRDTSTAILVTPPPDNFLYSPEFLRSEERNSLMEEQLPQSSSTLQLTAELIQPQSAAVCLQRHQTPQTAPGEQKVKAEKGWRSEKQELKATTDRKDRQAGSNNNS